MLDRRTDLLAEEPVEDAEHRERLEERPEEAEQRPLVAELEGRERELAGDEPVVVGCRGAGHPRLLSDRHAGT